MYFLITMLASMLLTMGGPEEQDKTAEAASFYAQRLSVTTRVVDEKLVNFFATRALKDGDTEDAKARLFAAYPAVTWYEEYSDAANDLWFLDQVSLGNPQREAGDASAVAKGERLGYDARKVIAGESRWLYHGGKLKHRVPLGDEDQPRRVKERFLPAWPEGGKVLASDPRTGQPTRLVWENEDGSRVDLTLMNWREIHGFTLPLLRILQTEDQVSIDVICELRLREPPPAHIQKMFEKAKAPK